MDEPSAALPPLLTIALFANFNVAINHKPVTTDWRRTKTRGLLAYLVLAQRQPVLRTTLSDLLWHGYTANAARTSLRRALTELRDSLAPFDLVRSDYQTVQLALDAGPVWCDVLRFEALLDECQRHVHRAITRCPACQIRLRLAQTLYEGAFLEQFPSVDSPPFDIWVQAQRTRLAARYAELERVLSPALLPLGNLPPPLTSLVGRTEELAQLRARLTYPGQRGLTLLGPGGIGKTRLALALAEQVRAHFPDGVWLVELGVLTPAPAADDSTAQERQWLHDRIATVISTAVGLTLQGANPPTAQLTAYVRDKAALLVLDSFEHFSLGAGLLQALLQEAPRLRLLITSRHQLALPACPMYTVEGLSLPPRTPQNGLTPHQMVQHYTALQLFIERAENVVFDLSLDEGTLAAISDLCRLFEGAPLAIELAAALLETQSPAQILHTVRANYAALQADLLDLPRRQRSAHAVFLTSWQLLAPHEAQALARCAVFRGGFMLAGTQVAGVTPAVLATLVQKSLLRPAGADRFTLHELVRQFAAAQLAQEPETACRAYERHAAYYLTLVRQWQPGVSEPLSFRQAVEAEIENIEAAWQWALTQQQVTSLAAALSGLAQFYRLASRYHAAEATFTQAVAHLHTLLAAQAIPTPAFPNGAPAATREIGRASAEQLRQQHLLAQLLANLCTVYIEGLAQPTRVAPLAQEVIAWEIDLAEPALQVEGYYVWSIAANTQGDLGRQQALLAAALPLAQAHGLRHAEAQCLTGLAMHAYNRYQYAASGQLYQNALALAQQSGDLFLVLQILNNLGTLHRDQGDWGQAAHYFTQNLELTRRLGVTGQLAYATASLGVLALQVADFAAAQRYLEEARQMFAAQGEQRLVAEILALLGANVHQAGDSASAIPYCQAAIALAMPAHYYVAQLVAWSTLGGVHLAQGQLALAADAYQQAIDLAQTAGNPVGALLEQAALSRVYLAQQQPAAALALLQPALTALMNNEEGLRHETTFRLNCYHVLAANHDPRAETILQQTWAAVQAQAASISDPHLRVSFLTKVPTNCELAQLIGEAPWAMQAGN